MPLFVIAAERDALARPWMAERLVQLAPPPATLRVIRGADHNDIMSGHGSEVLDAIRGAFQEMD
jgi:pimeloyl-ACP methyl ester carboxylesterase